MSAATVAPAAPPRAKSIPRWADTVEGPTWDPIEGRWERVLRWKRAYPEGGNVNIIAFHWTDPEGKVSVDPLHIEVDMEIESAEEARQVAVWLLEAADAIDGPRPVNNSWIRPEPLGTQRRVVENIRRLVKKVAYSQTEVAITAGYGMDEFSSFMTGRRLMDLTDVDRIATALRVSPLELLAPYEGE